MVNNLYKDKDWIRRTFVLPKRKNQLIDRQPALMTTATQKIGDTTLGGSPAINAVTQFTKIADPRVSSRYSGSSGYGRYYSEAFDDNAVYLHIRAGVPQYNSIRKFFSNAYSSRAGILARTGRNPGLFYNIGAVATFVVTLPLQAIVFSLKTLSYIINRGEGFSRYYNLKPSMHSYWTTVQSMANMMTINLNMVDPPSAGSTGDQSYSEILSSLWKDLPNGITQLPNRPKLFRKDGGIDVYEVANRYQTLMNRHREVMEEDLSQSREAIRKSLQEYQKEVTYQETVAGGLMVKENVSPSGKKLEMPARRSYEEYMEAWNGSNAGKMPDGAFNEEEDISSLADSEYSWLDGFGEAFGSFMKEGAEWITFKIDGNDSVTESFSNTFKDSELAGTINSVSDSSRTRNFTLAGGNLSDDVISKTVGGFISSVDDLATGVLSSVGLDGITMLLKGTGFADIPKVYQDSSTNLPGLSVKMELRAPYKAALSRFSKEILPTLMVMALGLPRAVGNATYAEPFLLEAYCKGRGQIRIGMIDSISIERGTNNLPFDRDGDYRGIDVSFNIVDLSSIVAVPIYTESSLLHEDTAFSDLMATYGSMSLEDQIYGSRKLKYNLKRKIMDWGTTLSPGSRASWLGDTMPARAVRDIAYLFDG